jgi:hypothetical protein
LTKQRLGGVYMELGYRQVAVMSPGAVTAWTPQQWPG